MQILLFITAEISLSNRTTKICEERVNIAFIIVFICKKKSSLNIHSSDGDRPTIGIQFSVIWFQIWMCFNVINIAIFVLNCGPTATEERLDLGSRVISVLLKALVQLSPIFANT